MIISKKTFDEERALYNLQDATVDDCKFEGPLDGESVLKETRNCKIKNCTFSLRYPIWHAKHFQLVESSMDDKTRAPIWYCDDGEINNCEITGIKCLRECNNVSVNNSNIVSSEFGWKCSDISLKECSIKSEYFLFDTKNVKIDNVTFSGKYSMQYMENVTITNSTLDTKDAFWHSKNVTVKNTTLKGEYLAWFSSDLTLIDCKIIGTQPFCYCENLTLINCVMEDTDLSFEYSTVNAKIIGNVVSIKNPKAGKIVCDSVDDIILDQSIVENKCEIIVNSALK